MKPHAASLAVAIMSMSLLCPARLYSESPDPDSSQAATIPTAITFMLTPSSSYPEGLKVEYYVTQANGQPITDLPVPAGDVGIFYSYPNTYQNPSYMACDGSLNLGGAEGYCYWTPNVFGQYEMVAQFSGANEYEGSTSYIEYPVIGQPNNCGPCN